MQSNKSSLISGSDVNFFVEFAAHYWRAQQQLLILPNIGESKLRANTKTFFHEFENALESNLENLERVIQQDWASSLHPITNRNLQQQMIRGALRGVILENLRTYLKTRQDPSASKAPSMSTLNFSNFMGAALDNDNRNAYLESPFTAEMESRRGRQERLEYWSVFTQPGNIEAERVLYLMNFLHIPLDCISVSVNATQGEIMSAYSKEHDYRFRDLFEHANLPKLAIMEGRTLVTGDGYKALYTNPLSILKKTFREFVPNSGRFS